MIKEKLLSVLKQRKVTIYQLSKKSGIKYELLRRIFSGTRKLTADELILIMDVTGISLNEIKEEQNDVSSCSAGII